MARSCWWGLIVVLHWPFCVYLTAISYAVIYDDEFDPDVGGIPAASSDDADRAINVSTFICVVAAGFGTLTDLIDIVISLFVLAPRQCKRRISRATARNDLSDQTPSPQKPLPKSRYLIGILRFIMIIFWFTVLIWGLAPTDVLMYIDYDPADGMEGYSQPYYSDTVIGFISLLLVLDFISFTGPLIQRCVLYFIPQELRSQQNIGKADKRPADGHREIGSVGLGQVKSAGSIPIGHTLSVEEV